MNTQLTYEFYKLDAIDRKVAYWLSSQRPNELYDYLKFIAVKIYECKGISLNVDKALTELHSPALCSIT